MSLVHPHGSEFSGYTIPQFEMPGCIPKHFNKGYKWWCKRCRIEAEYQFELVCISHWSSQRALRQIVDAPADTRLDVVQDIAAEELE